MDRGAGLMGGERGYKYRGVTAECRRGDGWGGDCNLIYFSLKGSGFIK